MISRALIRGTTGVLGLAVTGGVVAAALVLPLPSHTVGSSSVQVAPVPTDQQRVCPGPILALAADSRDAGAAAPIGVPRTVSGATTAADITGAGGGAVPMTDPQVTALASGATAKSPDAGTGGDTGGGDNTGGGRTGDGGTGGTDSDGGAPRNGTLTNSGSPVLLTVAADKDSTMPPLVAGSQSQKADQEDLAGFAAAGCRHASSDSWLVGGGADLGETSLVLLSNPSEVDAQVDLDVFGESGRVQTPGGTGITVPAGAQKVVPLAGLAPSVAAPVVHVLTHGGRVLATMQQSIVNGIDPAGVELIGGAGAPALSHRIAGVSVRTLKTLRSSQSTDSYGRDLPAARVLVPGDSPAHVSIGVVGEVGTSTGDTFTATLKPGVVTEIPLDGLTDGDYTVTVTSDQPVVAAAHTSTESKAGKDFAWYTPSAPLPAVFLAAVGPGPNATLHLVNPSTADVHVTVTNPAGNRQALTIVGGGAIGVRADVTGVYSLDGAAGLIASVGYSGDGSLSSFAIQPPPPSAAPLTVYPR